MIWSHVWAFLIGIFATRIAIDVSSIIYSRISVWWLRKLDAEFMRGHKTGFDAGFQAGVESEGENAFQQGVEATLAELERLRRAGLEDGPDVDIVKIREALS